MTLFTAGPWPDACKSMNRDGRLKPQVLAITNPTYTMPKVSFVTPTGKRITLENVSGNLMEIAQSHEIDGIDGDCGGVCSCSTCHVYVAAPWLERLDTPERTEAGTLDFDDRRKPNSRLSCQIELTEALDGLEVEIPARD